LSRAAATIDRAERQMDRCVPSFSFPLRDRFIQDGIGVKLIACVEAKPPPKVCKKKINYSPFINVMKY